MKFLNSIPYHNILEKLELKSYKTNKEIRIYTLYNFNPMVLNKYLEFYLKQKGLKSKIYDSNFDQVDQELLNYKNNSKLKKSDILIIGSDINSKLSFDKNAIDLYLDSLKNTLNQALKINNNSKNLQIIFWNSVFPSSDFLNTKNKFNSSDIKINNYNKNLFNFSNKYKNLNIFDLNKISNLVGNENLYEPKDYYTSKIPFSERGHNYISFELSQIINSITSISKKCLVVDLDNTLWGGVLGEDGIDGIKIGGTYDGEKYKNFQKYLKILSENGIILAISSKNNIQDVKECFKKHPEMILRFKDFSSVQINWEEKYLNLNKIAKDLNIGKDSIVFFDDSKFEREQMKKLNPSINIIETPKDPEYFIEAIDHSGFFHQNLGTKEDKKKKYQYEILRKANEYKSKINNVELFLKNLSMKLEISNINKFNFDRCVQLTNKVNQFNLTTRRYSKSELNLLIKSKKQISLVARLKDKFGDHGITALVISKQKKNKIWAIDTFLLSCRILGRKVEDFLLNEMLTKLKNKGIDFVEGIYIKTKKNSQCKNFFIKNDFVGKKGNKYLLNLKNVKKKENKFFRVKYVRH